MDVAGGGSNTIHMALLGTVIFLSAVLGGSSFLFGLLPLTISFSRGLAPFRHCVRGVYLIMNRYASGAPFYLRNWASAWCSLRCHHTRVRIGITSFYGHHFHWDQSIMLRGIETIYDHTTRENVLNSSHQGSHSEPPTFAIAMSTLLGFIFMLVAEQISSQTLPPSVQATTTPAHRHSPRSTPRIPPLRRSSVGYSPSRPLSPTTVTSITDGDIDLDLDVELNNFNNFNDRDAGWQTSTSTSTRREVAGRDPRLLTFGLVVHSIADGLALGASLVTSPEEEKSSGGILGSTLGLTSLPLLVFFALALHKGTQMGLTLCIMLFLNDPYIFSFKKMMSY